MLHRGCFRIWGELFSGNSKCSTPRMIYEIFEFPRAIIWKTERRSPRLV